MAPTQPHPPSAPVSPYASTQLPGRGLTGAPAAQSFSNPARAMTPPQRPPSVSSGVPSSASPSTLPARGGPQPLHAQSAKTLASGTSYDNLREQDSIRRGVARTTQPVRNASGQPLAGQGSALPTGAPGATGPQATQHGARPGQGPSGQGRAQPVTIATTTTTAPPSAPPVTKEDASAPSSRLGKRRATQTGRKSSASYAIANLPITPSVDVSIVESNAQTTRKPTVRRDVREESTSFDVPPRFEEEATTADRPPKSQPAPAPYQGGGYGDLDEQTNVLSRADLERTGGVDIPVDEDPPEPTRVERFRSRNDPPAHVESTTEMGLTGDLGSAASPGPLGLMAFRVALAADPARGTVDLHTLAPGEPIPAGMVGAMLVPTDLPSSQAISDLLQSGSKKQRGKP